ncbi:MAG: nucleotide-binding domain containing protein [Thermomicrobiales bacterium]
MPRSQATKSPRALAALATEIPRVLDRYDAMVLTGGDVAGAVCARLEAERHLPGGEVLPAIPWGTLSGGKRAGLPYRTTKAGSFGDERAMVDAVRFLTRGQTDRRPAAVRHRLRFGHLAQVANHVPVNGRAVRAPGFRIARPKRHVRRATDLSPSKIWCR